MGLLVKLLKIGIDCAADAGNKLTQVATYDQMHKSDDVGRNCQPYWVRYR